ncbi:MAG: hypothetical protein BJ554DRAFT_5685, partial [Olpidium bornovanus]
RFECTLNNAVYHNLVCEIVQTFIATLSSSKAAVRHLRDDGKRRQVSGAEPAEGLFELGAGFVDARFGFEIAQGPNSGLRTSNREGGGTDGRASTQRRYFEKAAPTRNHDTPREPRRRATTIL